MLNVVKRSAAVHVSLSCSRTNQQKLSRKQYCRRYLEQ